MRIQLSPMSKRAAAACVLVSAVCVFTGCASAPVNTHGRSSFSRDARSYAASLTAADFASVPNATTALEAVRQLRPLFLQPRPGGYTARGEGPVIAVYINDMYAGNVDVLQTIPPGQIENMRYLQRTEAMTFAGSQTRGDGFIMVRLKGFSRRGTQ